MMNSAGEVTERPKVRHWKCRVGVKPHRGFESRPLRCEEKSYSDNKGRTLAPSPLVVGQGASSPLVVPGKCHPPVRPSRLAPSRHNNHFSGPEARLPGVAGLRHFLLHGRGVCSLAPAQRLREGGGAMCGIAGVIDLAGRRPVPAAAPSAMAAALAHRGPDEDGFLRRPGVALASRRLSIIDLRQGRQPISNEANDVWVVFNGELFDYPEQRAELEARGHRFRTRCDTELLPHLWEDHGEGLFE